MKAGVQSGADVKPFATGADAMVRWGQACPALYSDGTQTGHNTRAKPELWSDRDGFEKAKLGDAVKSGDKMVFTATTQTRGGGHRNYRER